MASRQSAVDPLDRAIAQAVGPHPPGWTLLGDWPVQAQQPMALRLWRDPQGQAWLVAKGSPEHLAARCAGGAPALQAALQGAAALAAQGLRVLAVAHAPVTGLTVGEGSHHPHAAIPVPQVSLPQVPMPQVPLQWLGLLAFEAAPPSASVMKRPPRPASSGLLDKAHGWRSAGMGLLLLALLMGWGALAQVMQPQWSQEQHRAVVMTGLLAGNLSLVALPLAHGWGRAQWSGAAAQVLGVVGSVAVGLWVLSLQWPVLGRLLQVQAVTPVVLLATAAATAGLLAMAHRLLMRG